MHCLGSQEWKYVFRFSKSTINKKRQFAWILLPPVCVSPPKTITNVVGSFTIILGQCALHSFTSPHFMPYKMKTFGWIFANEEKMLTCWNQFTQTRVLDFHVVKLKHTSNLLKNNKCSSVLACNFIIQNLY